MEAKSYFLLVFICCCAITTLFPQADAKGIRVGGIKVKPPKVSVPKVSVPKPRVPIIVPIVAPIPIVGTTYYGRNNRNNRRNVQCYSCEGRDNDPCVLNPAALNGKIVTCSQNQYCSIIRRELPPQSTVSSVVISNGTITVNTLSNTTVPEKTNATTDTIMEVVSIPEGNNETTSNVTQSTTSSWSATLGNMWDAVTQGIRNSTFMEEMKNMSASSSNDPVDEVISPAHLLISRGCKSKDFLQGWMLQSSSGNSGNTSAKVYTQLCSSNLCNFGDGRLDCYECEGTGTNHSCMNNPSKVSKTVTCQPNEVCGLLRTSKTINSTSSNNTVTIYEIKRGCQASTVDELFEESNDTAPISPGMLSFTCTTDLCNAVTVDQLTRPRNSSAAGLSTMSFLLTLLLAAILHY